MRSFDVSFISFVEDIIALAETGTKGSLPDFFGKNSTHDSFRIKLFEVGIPAGLPVTGVILADQIKSMDWRARKAGYICALPPDAMDDVTAKLFR